MALDNANAGQLPNPPREYDQGYLRQFLRVLEIYFSQLDSNMPNHSEQYTARRFIGGDFHGGRFFGSGYYLDQGFQRFTSQTQQPSAPLGTANIATFSTAGFVSPITLVGGTKLTVILPGTYEINYNLQLASLATQQDVYVWLRVNGVDLPNTGVRFTVFNTGVVEATYTHMPILAAGDYVEIAWAPTNVNVYLWAEAARAAVPGVSPAIPATSSAVVDMFLVQADFPPDAELKLPRRLRPP